MHPDCPLKIAANEDGATPNYDQRGGPFNLDTRRFTSRQACGRGLRATQQNTINLMCMPVCFRRKAWTPCCQPVHQWGKPGRVHVKGGADPLSPEVGGAACQ